MTNQESSSKGLAGTSEVCPKCGAAFVRYDCLSAMFACGSGDGFPRTDRCRIAELERENERLREQIESVPSIQGELPWDFCCKWYKVEEIRIAISTQLRRHGTSRCQLGDIPQDMASPEFAEWMTHQYRLAMNKGMEIAARELARLRETVRRWERLTVTKVIFYADDWSINRYPPWDNKTWRAFVRGQLIGSDFASPPDAYAAIESFESQMGAE